MRKSEQYRGETLIKIRETGIKPHIWEVIGITKDEYETNGSAYKNEIKAADRALYDILQAELVHGWKVYGIERWDRVCNMGERFNPPCVHPRPSREEREYPRGFGSPIDWAKLLNY